VKVWAVANQKGGVGKTTTVVGVGGLLAQHGRPVLLIDLDPQGSLTSYFKLNPDAISDTVYDLFKAEEPSIAQVNACIRESCVEGLNFIPASTLLATLERIAVNKHGMGLVIARVLALLKQRYDYVLIDTPPVLGLLMVNALAASQHLLLPVQTEHLAIQGLERMMRTLTMVMRSQQRELPYTIIPTMYDRRTHASVSSLRILQNQYEDHLAPVPIGIDTRFRDASYAGIPPSAFDAKSRGVRAYRSLLKHLLVGVEA